MSVRTNRSTQSVETDYEMPNPRPCSRVQLILQGSLHCMTCSDGTGSLKFIQLPLPEVLLSGTQQLTVERVIEQSFDTINALTRGKIRVKDVKLRSPKEAKLEHNASRYDNRTLVLELCKSSKAECAKCRNEQTSVYESVEEGPGARPLPPVPTPAPPVPQPRRPSVTSLGSSSVYGGTFEAFGDVPEQRKILEEKICKGGIGYYALQLTPLELRSKIPYMVHTLNADRTFYRRPVNQTAGGKLYFDREVLFDTIETLLGYYKNHPVDTNIYLQTLILPTQYVYQPSSSIIS